MTGGPNSLELLWALLALTAAATLTAVAAITWVALWVEARLAGMTLDLPAADLPGALLALAAEDGRELGRIETGELILAGPVAAGDLTVVVTAEPAVLAAGPSQE